MKKIFTFICTILIAFGASADYTNTLNYQCGPTEVVVTDLSTSQYSQFKLAITQKAKNTAEYNKETLYDNTVELIINPDEHSIVGTFTMDDYSIDANSFLTSGSSTRKVSYWENSTITIESKGGNKYAITDGLLQVENSNGTTLYKYNYCYAADDLNNSSASKTPFEFTFGEDLPVPATLDSLVIKGKATKMEYEVGEAFDPAGLEVWGIYTKTVKHDSISQIKSGITWDLMPETFGDDDVSDNASVTMVASFNELTTADTTITGINVKAVVPAPVPTDEIVLATGNWEAMGWANQPKILESGVLGAAGAKAGQTLRIYVTPAADNWGCQVVSGWWSAIGTDKYPFNLEDSPYDLAAHNGALEIVLDDYNLAGFNLEGIVINGDGLVITKVALNKGGGEQTAPCLFVDGMLTIGELKDGELVYFQYFTYVDGKRVNGIAGTNPKKSFELYTTEGYAEINYTNKDDVKRNFIVNPKIENAVDSIYQGETYLFADTLLTTAGTYQRTIESNTMTLTLKVKQKPVKYTEYENWQIKYAGSEWENMTKVEEGLFKLADINWTGSGFNVKSDGNPIKKDWYGAYGDNDPDVVFGEEVIPPIDGIDVFLRVIDDEHLRIGVGVAPPVPASGPTVDETGITVNGRKYGFPVRLVKEVK